MKRGSFVFPLILIVIGILFLLHNLRPDLSVLSMVSRYWPFLLIGWGLLRAAEVIFAYLGRRPVPTVGISGGEWLVVVLIAILGSGASFANRMSGNFGPFRVRGIEMFGEPHDFMNTGQMPAAGATRLLVENLRGNTRIVAGATSEVRVTARNTVRALNEDEAQRLNKEMPLEIKNQAGQIVIRTNQEKATGDGRVSSDLEIEVPKTMAVECRGRYGDFDIAGLNAGVDINSDNAGVRLQDITGNARIELRRSDIVRAVNVTGNVEVKGRGEDLELENITGKVDVLASFSGDLSFRNVSQPTRYESSTSTVVIAKIPGYVRLTRGELVGSRLVGPVRITSRTKDVRLSEFTDTLEIDLDRGDVELRPGKLPLARMQVKTRNGDVDLALPENAKFSLKATTDRGEVENDYSPAIKLESSERRGGTLRGSTGPGPEITVDSNRGTVTLRKAEPGEEIDWDTMPAPSAPPAPKAPGMPKTSIMPPPALQKL